MLPPHGACVIEATVDHGMVGQPSFSTFNNFSTLILPSLDFRKEWPTKLSLL